MTYQEAIDYLDSLVNYEKKDGYDYRLSYSLDRMSRLSSLLGDPHKKVRSIHVAGTKGKGSTSSFIHSILKAAGYKAGLYTSPHLVSFCERIRIGDKLIGEDGLGVLMDSVKKACDALAGDRPTFFEACTALAYLHFSREKADIAVYEVGLGGRLDATNIIEPLVSVITPISYEHTALLGDTLGKIALEKAGIIKEDSVCVSAPQEPEALAVIEDVCRQRRANLILVGRDIGFSEMEAGDKEEVLSVSGIFNRYDSLRIGLLGYHQVVNAATAVGSIEALRLGGLSIDPDAVRRGLADTRWPGRMELVKGSPRVLLDGAQNGASAKALASSVRRLFSYRRLVLVLGVSKDKDIKAILKSLVPIADSIVLTKSRIAERACDPEMIRQSITPADKEVRVTENVADAIKEARSKAAPQDLILVTGSLFVVGEAREILLKSI